MPTTLSETRTTEYTILNTTSVDSLC